MVEFINNTNLWMWSTFILIAIIVVMYIIHRSAFTIAIITAKVLLGIVKQEIKEKNSRDKG